MIDRIPAAAPRSLVLLLALALAACGGGTSGGPGPGSGGWVLYGMRVSPSDSGFDLWAVREDGSGAHPLAATAAGEGFQAATPAGRVVYQTWDASGLTDLWSVRLDGSDTQVVSATAESDQLVAVGPGERLVVRTTSLETSSDLVAVNSDGTDPVVVAGSAWPEVAFAVTPGGRLVYTVALEGGNRQLRSVALDGTGDVALLPAAAVEDQEPNYLTPDGRVLAVVRPEAGGILLRSVPADGGEPATLWGDDGTEKAFQGVTAAGVAVITMADALYAAPADGSTEPILIAGSEALETFAGSTPDGRILYHLLDGTGHLDLHLVRPDGTDDVAIAPTATHEVLAAVADDGRIVFTRGEGDARDVLVFDPVAGEATPLAVAAEKEGFAGLQGTRLVFFRVVGDDLELHAVDLDGAGATLLVTGLPGVQLHALTPSGRAIFSSRDGDAADLHAVGLDGQDLHPLAATAAPEYFERSLP